MKNEIIYPGQDQFYKGKVRDLYYIGNVIVAKTSDRVSAYDVVLPIEIPKKGNILNLISAYNFEQTKDIIQNCLLEIPAPNTSIWLKTIPFKFEVIVRAYNTGSFYKKYNKTKTNPWGYDYVDESRNHNGKLPFLFVTPTTKAEQGHDVDISSKDIIKLGLATEKEWRYIFATAIKLFERGQKLADEKNLILVDTKYEFGKTKDGGIYLIDEVHTPDSSRYWIKDSFDKDNNPVALSKEFLREYLISKGFEGKDGQIVPDIDEDTIKIVSDKYLKLFNLIIPEDHKFYWEVSNVYEENKIEESILKSLQEVRFKIEGPKVSVVMGSLSDLPIMQEAIAVLEKADVVVEVGIVSAHRTPDKLTKYAQNLLDRGVKVVIAGAGGAAHLPGMIAANTILPVIGVPVNSSKSIDGWDSILSILQMPAGVPVATMARDGAENAGLLALQILATNDTWLTNYLLDFKNQLKDKVSAMQEKVNENYFFGG